MNIKYGFDCFYFIGIIIAKKYILYNLKDRIGEKEVASPKGSFK